MANYRSIINKIPLMGIYLLGYFFVSVFFLTDFPYIHSDEPWLAGLSRAMLVDWDFSLTEPFFDTYQRYPHGIRILFHGIQAIAISLGGYNVFSVRMVSLLFAMGTLIAFYALCFTIFGSKKTAAFTTILLSVDIQFIYASHFARQEIILVFILILSAFLLFHRLEDHSIWKDLFIGFLLGLGIGIHPNIFIISLAVGMLYLILILGNRLRWNNLTVLILITVLTASLFILVSLNMDPDFFANYLNSGEKFGVDNNLLQKFNGVWIFYDKLADGRGSTYYLPDLKFPFILFALSFTGTFIGPLLDPKLKKRFPILALAGSVIAINIGIMVIGRYNPTSIILIFPFLYIITVHFFFRSQLARIYPAILLGIIFLHTAGNFKVNNSTYAHYIDQIGAIVEKNDKVLANLNTGFYFDNEKLLDYRNLRYMADSGLTFEEYVCSREIEYIIYMDELDFIYENRPNYNRIYGNPESYYHDMKVFLFNNCEKITVFPNSTYGTHIARQVDKENWKITIYKVKEKP